MGLNPQETADLATFTEEILNGKLYFLCSEYYMGFLEHILLFAYFHIDILFEDYLMGASRLKNLLLKYHWTKN